jgi:pimeloyl-ACP methyl ester carboxylesterase
MSAWVLLRGLTREAGHWGGFPQRLQEALGEPVLPLDLPGNGSRHAERSPTSIAALAADLQARIAQLALPRPPAVLALSLGAMVAIEWARRNAGAARGLVLVATSLRPLAPMHWRLRPRAAARLLGGLLAGDARRLEQAVLELTSAGRDPAVLDDWLALRARHPVGRANAMRQLFAAARYRTTARPICPTLLLAGRGDRLVDPRCSARLAEAWNAPLDLHPWAGHDLPLDDPAWVVERVVRWRDTALA